MLLSRDGEPASRPVSAEGAAQSDRVRAEQSWRLDDDVRIKVVRATALSVIDGDSVVFRLADGRKEEVRLIGVDAPDQGFRRDVYVSEAAEYTKKKLLGEPEVFLEIGADERDRLGRLLVYVWQVKPTPRPTAAEVRGRMLNASILLDGYARPFPRKPNVEYPNSRYTVLFDAYASEARSQVRGLWDPMFKELAGSDSSWSQKPPKPPITSPFAGNRTSKKFHLPSCENAQAMKLSNRVPLETRREALKLGYVPCGICRP